MRRTMITLSKGGSFRPPRRSDASASDPAAEARPPTAAPAVPTTTSSARAGTQRSSSKQRRSHPTSQEELPRPSRRGSGRKVVRETYYGDSAPRPEPEVLPPPSPPSQQQLTMRAGEGRKRSRPVSEEREALHTPEHRSEHSGNSPHEGVPAFTSAQRYAAAAAVAPAPLPPVAVAAARQVYYPPPAGGSLVGGSPLPLAAESMPPSPAHTAEPAAPPRPVTAALEAHCHRADDGPSLPQESAEDLLRELREDQRLAEDLPFTPSHPTEGLQELSRTHSTRASARSLRLSHPNSLSQHSYRREEAEEAEIDSIVQSLTQNAEGVTSFLTPPPPRPWDVLAQTPPPALPLAAAMTPPTLSSLVPSYAATTTTTTATATATATTTAVSSAPGGISPQATKANRTTFIFYKSNANAEKPPPPPPSPPQQEIEEGPPPPPPPPPVRLSAEAQGVGMLGAALFPYHPPDPDDEPQDDEELLTSPRLTAAAAEAGPPPPPLGELPVELTPSSFCAGLPPEVGAYYERKGVRELYPWQREVLHRRDLMSGGNFIYSMPTSGGKTLVAELSLLRCLLRRRQSCFFVVPFVSLAEEKCRALEPLGGLFDFAVEGHYGSAGRVPAAPAPAVYVCTMEKANSVLNSMIEEGREAEIGAVVVDELHMLGESRRGAILELFLSKLLLLAERRPTAPPNRLQLIGMSATVSNLPAIATWLRASCYQGTYRPVDLRQYSVVDGLVLQDGTRNVRNLGGSSESEHFMQLVTEDPEGLVLIFCASRLQCMETARTITRELRASLDVDPGLHPSAAVAALLAELRGLSHSNTLGLADVVPYGVAFHHGGLLTEERELIETAFRRKQLRVLCCTSTLAAGVNLPARRVIFKTPYVGREFLTKARYLQMCGRAGRAGLDSCGESYLLLRPRTRDLGHQLMRAPVESCDSQVLEDFMQFTRALMECIGTALVTTRAEALVWCRTLLYTWAPGPLDPAAAALVPPEAAVADHFEALLEKAFATLVDSGFVQRAAEEGGAPEHFHVTPFGGSSLRSYFSIEEALLVRDELDQLQHTGLILADDLHLCYFLTPLREVGECDWGIYQSLLGRLSDCRQCIVGLLGVDERLVQQRAMGLGGTSGSEKEKRDLFIARRFYVALMLADLLAEVAITDVEVKYNVNRGQVQSLMRSASMFSSSMTSFCKAMEWHALEAVLASFVKRLGFGVKPDLLPLMEIKGVQPARARVLWTAGYKDPTRLAAADPRELLQRVKEANPPDNKSAKFFTLRSAVVLIREAQLLLNQQIETKRMELGMLTGPHKL